ncbi:MAG: arsenite methyltransferase [Bacteroidales bacterium]|nr:arsenite methyltransferase [Bacteroidales bacterium]
MNTVEDFKKSLQERFTEIVYQSEEYFAEGCGCGSGCGCHSDSEADDYASEPGYQSIADLGLGTGMPTRHAAIKEGDTVVDLGSGAGIDCFLAREITGLAGKVIGVDMTEKMVEKARKNAEVAGYNNVEFRLGDIEKLPVSDKSAHVVIGNGVMSLTPDKEGAIREVYRILKHHGQLCISDIMVRGDMPKGMKMDADLYMGCMAGSLQVEEYMKMLEKAGFEEISIKDEKKLELPDAMLHYYLPPEETTEFREGRSGIYSITLSAEKPCCHAGEEDHVCCGNH